MATNLTATFDGTHGFVRLIGSGVPAGYHIYRLSPRFEGGSQKLPAYNYTVDQTDPRTADYLVPMGSVVTYGLKHSETEDDTLALNPVTVTTPTNAAFMRHLFYPSLSFKLRLVEFTDRRPSRLTTYAISGQRNAATTWDMRGGREATMRIGLDGFNERQLFEHVVNSGAPVSIAICMGLGNEPGIFAVGDIEYARIGKRDRWIATIALTEIDMPRILGYLDPTDIPGPTYDDKEAELGVGRTYDDAKAKWPFYYRAMI